MCLLFRKAVFVENIGSDPVKNLQVPDISVLGFIEKNSYFEKVKSTVVN